MDVLMKRPDFHNFSFLGTFFYRFNVTRKPLNDLRVRRAFALATDKQRIVRKLTFGGEKAAAHFVPEGVANYQSPEGLGFDPDQARRLLADAGYPGGRGFRGCNICSFPPLAGARKSRAKLRSSFNKCGARNLVSRSGCARSSARYSTAPSLALTMICPPRAGWVITMTQILSLICLPATAGTIELAGKALSKMR